MSLPPHYLQAGVEQALASAPMRVSAVQPAALDFWASYLKAAGRELPIGAGLMAETAQLVGARLVLLALELLPAELGITPHATFALQLARYLFAYPLQAFSDLLGINAQRLMSGDSELASNATQHVGATVGTEE